MTPVFFPLAEWCMKSLRTFLMDSEAPPERITFSGSHGIPPSRLWESYIWIRSAEFYKKKTKNKVTNLDIFSDMFANNVDSSALTVRAHAISTTSAENLLKNLRFFGIFNCSAPLHVWRHQVDSLLSPSTTFPSHRLTPEIENEHRILAYWNRIKFLRD